MFVYIDESGHPHPNDHPRPVDVGVCLKREDVRHIAGALHRFSEDFRASIGGSATLRRDEREGKATAFLSRKAILGGWPAKRVYVDSVMDLIRNLDVTIFAMVMERPDRPIYRGGDFLQLLFSYGGRSRDDADIIRQKTFDWDEDGVRFWGIRTMGKDHFRYEE